MDSWKIKFFGVINESEF